VIEQVDEPVRRIEVGAAVAWRGGRGEVLGEDGTPDGGLVRAVAALGLPQADRALAAQVIARATGARLHERDSASSVL
jgi:hypothetical protein